MDGFTYHCGLLRMFDGFSDQSDSRVPAFVYQHDDPELQRLRTRYNLDAIAQDGDDWSKALKLLRWVCDHMCHFDIAKSLPLNAWDLLDYSFGKGEKYGINCLMLATVLTEACLSIGLKARLVGIFPLNPFDLDNHVVTIVWCESGSAGAQPSSATTSCATTTSRTSPKNTCGTLRRT